MRLAVWAGRVLFFAVPAVLWLIGTAAAKRKGLESPLLAFIGGSDNRLSLSRLQAFLWTLVIFGAFAAAMVVSTEVSTEKWIEIPTELLQLAGIAITSGVLSSLISSVSGEEKSAVVTDLDPDPSDPSWTITGKNLGDNGSVRFGRVMVTIHEWTDQKIRVVLPNEVSQGPLIVDTAKGKVCHIISGTRPRFTLGEPRTYYEFVDLFRNDRSPRVLDVMKFQMFGWTLVAIVLYVIFFLGNLEATITKLPIVNSSTVMLTGLSQIGYLADKGVSIIGKRC